MPATARAADFGRYFVPEDLTQLFHSGAYELLSEPQRLRYNQLYAAHINEQFLYFELAVGNPISAALLAALERRGEAGLAARVRAMMQDEERHSALFRRFNAAVFPALCSGAALRFIRPSAAARLAMACLARLAPRLPFLVWVALFFEELSVHLSSSLLRAAERGARLEPAFVELHRSHLRDEERHVRLYPELIRALLRGTPAGQRRRQGWLLKRFMREVLAPKRSGLAVVRQLTREFPSLRGSEGRLVAAVRGLKDSPAFVDALFGPARLPVMHGMFREFPEFTWNGYRG